ncbi:MAG: ribosome-associated translation inhibitor RaiA [Alphaproteobacteria bacterium]|nr:ribosome-associated translation inhibitor RaiA [Alphaproteobacteria bacterium]
MQLQISGRHVDLGESFRAHAEKRLNDSVSKYLDRVPNVDVVVGKEAHQYRVDIHGNTGTHSGIVVKSQAFAPDVYAAFDAAAEKISKQLRRYKRRLKGHHHGDRKDTNIFNARKYVLQTERHEELEEQGAPLVIAEKSTPVETLTVSEAVMKMDLAHLPALLFFNAANGRINVVYRREDGNISWVDPEGMAA